MQLSNEQRAEIGAAFSGEPLSSLSAASVRYVPLPNKASRFDPIGDPSNGPGRSAPFGYKRRHDIPVAAFAAVFAGTATVVQVAAVVSFAGTALSVVGAVTGNEKLMKIGGIMGLAGGVVSLAAGAFSTAASAAGEGLGGAGGALGQGGDYGLAAATEGGASAATTGLGEAGTAGLASATESAGNMGVPSAVEAPVASNAPPPVDSSQIGASASQSTQPLSSTPQASPVPGTEPAYGSTSAATSTETIAPPKSIAEGGTGSAGWWDGLTKAQKERVANALIQGGGQAIDGMFKGWSEEQKLELQQHAYNTQQNSMRSTGAFKRGTVGGLINSARAA